MIIRHEIEERTHTEMKNLQNAGLRWDYLKRQFLKFTNTKAMKLMRMANWSWDSEKMDEREALREI